MMENAQKIVREAENRAFLQPQDRIRNKPSRAHQNSVTKASKALFRADTADPANGASNRAYVRKICTAINIQARALHREHHIPVFGADRWSELPSSYREQSRGSSSGQHVVIPVHSKHRKAATNSISQRFRRKNAYDAAWRRELAT